MGFKEVSDGCRVVTRVVIHNYHDLRRKVSDLFKQLIQKLSDVFFVRASGDRPNKINFLLGAANRSDHSLVNPSLRLVSKLCRTVCPSLAFYRRPQTNRCFVQVVNNFALGFILQKFDNEVLLLLEDLVSPQKLVCGVDIDHLEFDPALFVVA